jgi:lipid II:glycine glycyltransferase (peptidoglycan interpeptide bridge formation enzyme)
MLIREVRPEEKDQFNALATHPLQTWEWGEFRIKTGLDVVRLGIYDKNVLTAGYQFTLHPLPKLQYYVGYMPKSAAPTMDILEALRQYGIKHNIIYLKFEPNLYAQSVHFDQADSISDLTKTYLQTGCVRGRPLFTKYSFMLDLTMSEEEILQQMKPKTRYNINVAQKKGVLIKEDSSEAAFSRYMQLTFETTKRQKFYAHDAVYHQKMWDTLKPSGMIHLLTATYSDQILVTWIVFICNGVLYYPYGASSSLHRNVMASNLMMWEAIKFGKKMGCSKFDMWGSLGPNPNPLDPWIGFHRFKEGYGPTLMEFIGSFDLVINPALYQLYTVADNLRWKYLKLRANLPF